MEQITPSLNRVSLTLFRWTHNIWNLLVVRSFPLKVSLILYDWVLYNISDLYSEQRIASFSWIESSIYNWNVQVVQQKSVVQWFFTIRKSLQTQSNKNFEFEFYHFPCIKLIMVKKIGWYYVDIDLYITLSVLNNLSCRTQ